MPANRGSKVRVWENRSRSNPDKSYETIQWANGEITCNCRGWIFPKNGNPRTCVHVRGVEGALMSSSYGRSREESRRVEPQRSYWQNANIPIQEVNVPIQDIMSGVGINFSLLKQTVKKQKIKKERKSDHPLPPLETINPLFKKYKRMIRIAEESK